MNQKEKGLTYTLAFLKPNNINYSETFLNNQINGLSGPIKVLYGGAFPTKVGNGKFLIDNPFSLLSYFIQKKILKRLTIKVRDYYLTRYLKRNNISVVLAQYGVCGAMVAKACEDAGVPLVIHFHGFDVYDQSTLAVYGPFYPNAFRYATHSIAVSKEMVESLVALGAPRKKVSFISCGVDTKYFVESDPKNSPNTFLSVARFAEKKSPSSTIKAFKIVKDNIPDAKLIMAGIGPLWEDCKKLSKELGLEQHIKFLGVQTPSEVRELIKNVRAFVQHSVTAFGGDKEGTPTSVLEASSSGLPVISTYHAGIPDAVIHNETGFLVEEYNIEEMAKYMIILAENPVLAEKMGEMGRLHIQTNYNLQGQIKKLDAILINAFQSC